ncbi:MAG: NADH-quinone oxidoreductase subunit A [Fidelibacterota bacterium]
MLENYTPLLLVFLLAAGFAFLLLILSHLLGPQTKSAVKLSSYESGVDPLAPARVRISVKYFLIALLFVIFDIEIVFLFPWAVIFKDFVKSGSFIFLEMLLFMLIILFGFVFVWKKGALEWE